MSVGSKKPSDRITQKSKQKLSTFDKCLLFITGILSSALLLSYLAPVTDPQTSWVIALLGLMYPLLLIINFILAIIWLIRKSLYSLIPAICILIGVKIIALNLGFNQRPLPDKTTGTIRVMAYNVQGFGKFSKTAGQSKTQQQILALINETKPDIINLEEAYIDVKNRDSIYVSLKKTVGGNYSYFKASDFSQWDTAGIAIFSRYPILARGAISSPVGGDKTQAIFADIKYKASVFRVYCVHLQSTRFNDDDHEYLKGMGNNANINFKQIGVIENKLKAAFINRSRQVALINESIAKCPYPYLIAGDFNDTPISFTVNQLGNNLKNAFVEKGSGFGITYYGDFPHAQIDYILLSPQFMVNSYRVIEKKLSDHYPVVSDIQPPALNIKNIKALR